MEELSAAGGIQIKKELKQWSKIESIDWREVYELAFPDEVDFEKATKGFPSEVWADSWNNTEEFEVSVRAVTDHCDSLLWFQQHHEKCPVLTRVAMRYAAKPPSNSFQERVFSSFTYMSKQRQRTRLSSKTFNYTNVVRVNKDWIHGKEKNVVLKVWTCEIEKFFGCSLVVTFKNIRLDVA